MEISYSQKNKWDDDWAQYWFYAKIAFPSVSDCQEREFIMLRAVAFPVWSPLCEKKSTVLEEFKEGKETKK
jgi:hypothetical protein